MAAKADTKAKAAAKPAAKAEAKPKADAKAKSAPKPKADAKPKVDAKVDEVAVGKKIPQPNKNEYDDKIKVLDGEIAEYKAKIAKITKLIDTKSVGKEEFIAKRDEAKANQDAAAAKVDELEKERAEAKGQHDAKLATTRNAKDSVRDMQKEIGFRTEAEIDEKINDLEYQMHTETLTLKREKEIMAEISKLKAIKPKLNKMKRMATSTNVDDAVVPLRAKMDDLSAEIQKARDERKHCQNILKKIIEERRKAFEGVPELYDERKALNAEVKKRLDAIKAIRDEKNLKMQEYYAQRDEQWKIYNEQYALQQEVRDAEKAKYKIQDELNRADELPFTHDIELLENAIKYCKGLQPASGAKAEAPVSKVIEAVEGTTVLLSKKDRADDFFIAPTKKKSQKGKKDGDAAAGDSKALKHELRTLTHFEKVKVSVPMTVKDLPAAIATLEEKLQKLKADQLETIAKRKAERADKEKALEEAAERARIAAEKSEQAQKRVAAVEAH